jgi:hypothetical protein
MAALRVVTLHMSLPYSAALIFEDAHARLHPDRSCPY